MVSKRYAQPEGVCLIGDGVDVALFAPDATKVEFCLLHSGQNGKYQEERFELSGPHYGFWNGHVSGVSAGQEYGFRVHGPWNPQNGHWFNPAKLLVDPYARAVVGEYKYCPEVFSYSRSKADLKNSDSQNTDLGSLRRSFHDSAPFVPHSVVVHDLDSVHPPVFHPNISWKDTVIYETHVKGFTKNASWLPKELRGTYAGIAHPDTINHLQYLGVTTLELLPIHSKISEEHLMRSGLTNYWGYSNLSFFAPNPDYATKAAQEKGGPAIVDEVRGMVHLLHEAGIEVIMDVVYNHTCEEGNLGPTLSYRGIANQNYYCHPEGNPGELFDTTGCGNSLNFREPHVIRMALDSLRYWATEIGVDGFRFDLMVTTARDRMGFTKEHPFLIAMKNDPILGNLKMIAEPWDLGPDGWRTGEFGFPFSEWNDRFRNDVRRFWVEDIERMKKGWSASLPQSLATRIAGSSDVFGSDPTEKIRGPVASINYITAHDGFTLRDLVSFDHKHNEANLEGNRDGSDDNLSYNHGVEGIASDSKIQTRRIVTVKNMLTTLLLSSGTPMLTGGDEFGRTQQGNNNAYCQDSEISWFDWNLTDWQMELIETVRHLIKIRHDFPAIRHNKFFTGKPYSLDKLADSVDREGNYVTNQLVSGELNLNGKLSNEFGDQALPDLSWYMSSGEAFSDEAWRNTDQRAFQVLFSRTRLEDKDLLLVINGKSDTVDFVLPQSNNRTNSWELLFDTTWYAISKPKICDHAKVSEFSIQVFGSVLDNFKKRERWI
ncbi:MAG: glycogen debranching protein GlgX [Candidatus Ancillula sp.]|jgi:glycogen operon protein|nr:glycogen debranching protein GlgX [Candidatus Ancillula sp.]